MSSTIPLRRAGLALTGPIIWAGHFLAVYASESLVCRWGEPAAHDAIVAGATFFAVAAILLHAHRTVRKSDAGKNSEAERFMRLTTVALDGLSVIGVCWAGLAALLLGACR